MLKFFLFFALRGGGVFQLPQIPWIRPQCGVVLMCQLGLDDHLFHFTLLTLVKLHQFTPQVSLSTAIRQGRLDNPSVDSAIKPNFEKSKKAHFYIHADNLNSLLCKFAAKVRNERIEKTTLTIGPFILPGTARSQPSRHRFRPFIFSIKTKKNFP